MSNIDEILNLDSAKFKEKIKQLDDVNLLELLAEDPSLDVDKKEIVEERIKELKEKKNLSNVYTAKKEKEGSKAKYIFCNFIGAGGCGTTLTLYLYYEFRKNYSKYLDYCDFMACDLSIEIHETFKQFEERFGDNNNVKKITLGLHKGAGRVAKFTDYVLKTIETRNEWGRIWKEIVPRTRNYGFASLGGGTGSRTIPSILQRAKDKGYDCIGIGVLTNNESELLNHIYSMPLFFKSTDILIFIEREAMKMQPFEDQVCDHIRKIIPMFESTLAKPEISEQKRIYPQLQDLSNYKTILARSKLYREGVNWLIPFYYECDAGEQVKPLELVLDALDNPLVRVINDSEKTKVSIVILELPPDGFSKTLEIHWNLKEKLNDVLCDKGGMVLPIVIENKSIDKSRALILMHGILFRKLEEICNYDTTYLANDIDTWIFRLGEEINNLKQNKQEISEIRNDVANIFNEQEIRDEIKNSLDILTDKYKLVRGFDYG